MQEMLFQEEADGDSEACFAKNMGQVSEVRKQDRTANASGIWLKCTRGCGTEFELIVRDGEQQKK